MILAQNKKILKSQNAIVQKYYPGEQIVENNLFNGNSNENLNVKILTFWKNKILDLKATSIEISLNFKNWKHQKIRGIIWLN